MKKLILAVAALAALGGCIAVPVSDAGPPRVGVYVTPPVVFYGAHRHYR
jgi:hypothetical protein